MALFQKPAATLEEAEQARPLAEDPAQVALLDEATWRARIYRGDGLPQLTVRAVAMGSLLGFLLAFTNLYIGLKTGWGFGIAITACILSFSIWNGLLKIGVARTPMSILESNCMQSTATAAGSSTGGTMVSAVAALLMLSVSTLHPRGQHLSVGVLAAWTFFVAVLGVALAIPMKRSMINLERLPFPSGLAAATTLQTLYSQGGDALKKARALFVAAVAGGLTPWLIDLKIRSQPAAEPGGAPELVGLIPESSRLFDWLPARGINTKLGEAWKAGDWTMVFDHKLMMIAAGALVGLRVSLSMLAGGLVLAYVLGPEALTVGAAKGPERAWRDIGVWMGAPMMVAAGLVAFAWQWRTIARALSRRQQPVANSDDNDAAIRAIEVPNSWFFVLLSIGGIGVTVLGHVSFGIPYTMGALAVVMTYFLSLVACRVGGESDITPIGPMGKIVQLTYGALLPQNATANLMTAGITAGAAGAASDLLVDLKSGYLLGANPRRQFIAQFLGIFAGTVATVAGFYLLVPDAISLTGDAGRPPAYPAPAAQSWLAVARVFQHGLSSLHPMAQQSMIVGLAIGGALAATEKLFPRASRFLPSPTGFGLGFIMPFNLPISMFLGAAIAWAWTRRHRISAELYLVAVSSGIVAGESIMGVVVAALNNFVFARGP